MCKERGLHVGVAVDADELLRDVVDAFDVRPCVGHVRRKHAVLFLFHGDAEAGKYGDQLFFGHRAAEDAAEFRGGEPDVAHLLIVHFDVDDSLAYDAAARLVNEGESAFESVFLRGEVDALFKTSGAVRAQVQCARCAAHAVAREFRGLEDDGGSVGLDAAVLSAHDARDRHGFFRVADGQHGRVERVVLAVEGDDVLPLFRPAHHDLPSRKIAGVEGVHGLTYLDEDVVGDVHYVVDGTDPHRAQSAADLFGRREYLHVSDARRHISGAKILVLHRHAYDLVHARARGFIADLGLAALRAKCDRHFLCQLVDAVAVGAIRSDGDVQHHVVETECDGGVDAELRALRKTQDVVLLLSVDVGGGEPDLFGTAEHTL